MANREKDTTARARIRTYLDEHGPVCDENGGATTLLREAVGYEGSAVAFIQLITAMDDAGEIVREIRGKRTYSISADELPRESAGPRKRVRPSKQSRSQQPRSAQEPVIPAATAQLDIDYDELARALLRELTRVLVANQADTTAPNRALVAQRDRLQAERDEYAARLESSRRRLNALVALYVREDNAGDSEMPDALRVALAQLQDAEHAESVERAS
ncbi:hypothetical protein [Nocardia miyunensis]|uniref:hypothetical protein n=1 Tax=Nocardia miyunensis TaxID=282684 RepID=UPI000832E4B4|nr:hypothetical protein [Nocardia miyunensis]